MNEQSFKSVITNSKLSSAPLVNNLLTLKIYPLLMLTVRIATSVTYFYHSGLTITFPQHCTEITSCGFIFIKKIEAMFYQYVLHFPLSA